MPPGRGRGPGRGPPAARVARAHHVQTMQAQAAEQQQQQAPQKNEEPPPKDQEEAPTKQEISYDCEFPRCDKPSEYGFKDVGSYPQFCVEHKSDEMILLVPDPEHPKETSLERARQYKKMEPELVTLKDAPAKAAACEAEIKKLSSKIHKEDEDIKKLTKAIEELDAGLASQEKKPKRRGKTLLGKGVLAQDQNVIDRLTKDKESKTGQVEAVKGQKVIDESHIEQLKEDLKPLKKDAAEYASIKKTMNELKAKAVETEASALYLQLKAKGMEEEMNAEGDRIFARLLDKA